MKILVLGGTGAMGEPLVGILGSDPANQLYVVSRKPRESTADNIHYVQGDAFNTKFFRSLVSDNYDVIVDFLIWDPKALKKWLPKIISCCGQYIAAGTSSEYADTHGELITEETPRLYDSYSEKEKKQTDRYHIKKTVADNYIMEMPSEKWTIFRPWVTYNIHKTPLITVPEAVWLWRYKHNRTIFLPKQVMDKKCSLTYGDDAARAISKLIGNPRALGQVVNIATNKWNTWQDVIDITQKVLWELNEKALRLYYLEDASVIWKDIPSQYDPIASDRFYDRCFCTDKLNSICGEEFEFCDFEEGLRKTFTQVFTDPEFHIGKPSPEYNGLMDRLSGEVTPYSVYPRKKMKIRYLIAKNPVLSGIKRGVTKH